MLQVEGVKKGSVAEELGLEPGFQLVSINGRELEDFLDWEYLTSDESFVLEARSPGGELIEYEITRPEGLPLGVELAPPEVIVCNNRCDFCFVRGNPKGLRRALYVKDDDYRLSFRYGNFVTLTNVDEKDMNRIVEYQLTPLYVSVHASDVEVRRRLLGNCGAPDVMDQLRFLGEQGVECHTQIVMQPGVNDGLVLVRTLSDLYGLGTTVLSVSVVPVGLTIRNQKRSVRVPTTEECGDAIVAVDQIAARSSGERGVYWAYGSDELYMRAGAQLPPVSRYDDFEQLENGVGVVRYFQGQIREFSQDLSDTRIGIVTGTAMGGLFPEILTDLSNKTGAQFEVLPQINDLFGPSVTTAGLLPGRSFVVALAERDDLDLALIPAEALNDDDVFIDDVSLGELKERSPAEVRASHWIVDALKVGIV